MMRSSSRMPACARLAVRCALPMTSSSFLAPAITVGICSVASPRTRVVPDQFTSVSVVEKTIFSLLFIREVMAGSLALACSVGQ
jgi:hypothetical protein